jgi:hypothetical protein
VKRKKYPKKGTQILLAGDLDLIGEEPPLNYRSINVDPVR